MISTLAEIINDAYYGMTCGGIGGWDGDTDFRENHDGLDSQLLAHSVLIRSITRGSKLFSDLLDEISVKDETYSYSPPKTAEMLESALEDIGWLIDELS